MPTLNFVLSPTAAQKVHDALHCLSKFSEYVSIEARRNRLSFIALNSTKSAYAAIHLAAGRFFDLYQFVPSQGHDESQFTCRLYVKALLTVFRQRYFDSRGGETAIEKCEVRFDDNPSRGECRLNVKLICKHGVVKIYKLTYEEADVMHAIFDRDLAPNRWKIASKALKEHMEHFGPKAENLEITSGDDRAAFTSFTDKLIDGKEILKQPLQTSVSLQKANFEEFAVEDDLRIGVSLKDFKAMAAHAELLDIIISAFYSTPGRPLQLVYGREGLDCEFTLMTLAETRGSQQASLVRQAPRRRESAAPTASRGSTAAASVRADGSVSPQGQPPNQSQGQAHSQPQSQPHSQWPFSQGQLQQPVSANEREASNGEDLYQMPPPRLVPEISQRQSQPRSFSQGPAQPPSQARPLPSLTEISPPERRIKVDSNLFLGYSSSEDEDDDHGRGLNDSNEPVIGWDTVGNMTQPVPVARDQDETVYNDETEDEEDLEQSGVGPTQVSQVRGLFD